MDAIPVRENQDQNDLVCHCAGVGRARIKAAIATAPASTLESLGSQLGCGVHCGCCRPLVQELLGESPWYEVANATRTTLTDGRFPQRSIVQLDLQLVGFPPYPQAKPAQHVVLQAWIDDAWITRTYTVVKQSEDGNTVSIAMRRLPYGELTTRLLDADETIFAAIPMRIAVPAGEADPADGRPVVCFVAGVGVTLALSLLNGRPPGQMLHVDYSASYRGDMVYADRIEASASGSREVSCFLRADDVDGHIDDEDIRQTVQAFPGARFYVCGPQGYTGNVVDGLRNAGVPDADVRVEAFFLKSHAKPRRSVRRLAYAAGLAVAFLPLLLLAPALAKYVPNAAHNPGHADLACTDCHRDAPGTMRQQLQAKAKHLLGLRGHSDFGMRAVGNPTCIGCHDNPDDRHPAHRFLEPRFEAARRRLAPEQCVSCHREHTGSRVSQTDSGFCAACHSDTQVKDDPTTPTHAVLFAEERWDTCLTCHDFHGNHAHDAPDDLDDALAPGVVAAYLQHADSPYGETVVKAKQPETAQ
ncbi:(2Fe-2S)-binding protein [Lysobacter hankyongensis]|uniref:FAD-binding FR-type domain-containing protein n=1 Tax=Lysobacter hankyongensis TaxID=1176535 RepID=A0ABP9C4C3_9GAMM